MNRNDFEKISDVSKSLKKILRDHSAADSILVSRAWRWVSGEIIFAKTDLAEIRHDEIILRVEEDRWFQEICSMKSELCDKLNDCLGTKRFKRIVLKRERDP